MAAAANDIPQFCIQIKLQVIMHFISIIALHWPFWESDLYCHSVSCMWPTRLYVANKGAPKPSLPACFLAGVESPSMHVYSRKAQYQPA